MQLSQIPRVAATFDEVNLVPSAGLVPVMRLARLTGLESLVDRMVTVPGGAGVDAAAKVASIVAGMVTGADSIDDMDALREGAVGEVPLRKKAPSTLGTFLPAFTFGHVRQLGAVAGAMLARLAFLVNILSGHDDHRDAVTWLDVDDTIRETYGYAKQGVGYGYWRQRHHVAAVRGRDRRIDHHPFVTDRRPERGEKCRRRPGSDVGNR